MKTVTTAQMKALDEEAIQRFGIPSLLLMENAGRGICGLVEEIGKVKRVAVLCGKGNNGGDGLVCARHLLNKGVAVTVFLTASPEDLKQDPALNYKIVRSMGIPVVEILTEDDFRQNASVLEASDLVVDALLGIGVTSEVRSPAREMIQYLNSLCKKVVSIDIPSGLDSDTGQGRGCVVKAEITGTLGAPKEGLLKGDGPLFCGQIKVIDIGIPAAILPA